MIIPTVLVLIVGTFLATIASSAFAFPVMFGFAPFLWVGTKVHVPRAVLAFIFFSVIGALWCVLMLLILRWGQSHLNGAKWAFWVPTIIAALSPYASMMSGVKLSDGPEALEINKGMGFAQIVVVLSFVLLVFVPALHPLWNSTQVAPTPGTTTDHVFRCSEPIGEFTLGPNWTPTPDQETSVCACVWGRLDPDIRLAMTTDHGDELVRRIGGEALAGRMRPAFMACKPKH